MNVAAVCSKEMHGRKFVRALPLLRYLIVNVRSSQREGFAVCLRDDTSGFGRFHRGKMAKGRILTRVVAGTRWFYFPNNLPKLPGCMLLILAG